MSIIHIKRIYEPAIETDGFRILADRLWPRGKKKLTTSIDEWNKQIAPSTALRKWFNHEPEKFKSFRIKYLRELEENPAVNELLEQIEGHKTVTLLYGAKDKEHNHAIVLQDFLMENIQKS